MNEGTHVVFDGAAADRLAGLAATSIVRCADNLLLGPSRRDHTQHMLARRAWWGEDGDWDQLYAPHIAWTTPIVVWVSTSIAHRVNLWRVCHWLRQKGVPRRDILIIELDSVPPRRRSVDPLAAWDCGSSVADHPAAVLLSHLRRARPWTERRYLHAVRMWRRYTSEDPRLLARSLARGGRGHPGNAGLWTFLSSVLPRTTGARLSVSPYDEALLGALSSEWRTPVKVFVDKSPAGEELRELSSCAGDLFVVDRLDQWVARGAVERDTGPKPDTAMLRSVYRISERGARLREAGHLEELSAAPPLPVGGIVAYESPWAVQDRTLVALPE